MASVAQVVKSVGPKLVPFFKSVAVYFVLYIPYDKPSVWAMFVKTAPILSLMIFVLMHGMSLGEEYAFSRRILVGLVFSCIGDCLLIWPNYFLHGMAAFAVAQIAYICAFEFKPLKLTISAITYGLNAYVMSYLVPCTAGPLRIGLIVYSTLLSTTVWRAVARVQFFEDLWTWTKLCSCFGGMFFALSDTLIAFNNFYHPMPHAQLLIMVTYYIAQLGIALSTVDSKSSYNLAQEKLKMEGTPLKSKRSANKQEQRKSCKTSLPN